jgi:hypothetical protein
MDVIPGFCVPEMFSRALLSSGPFAPLHPATWESWVADLDLAWHGDGTDHGCAFASSGVPCDCACGCGWGNLGCGWACEERNRPPECADEGTGPPLPRERRMYPPPPWFAAGWHVAYYERESRRVLEDRMDALPRHGPEMGGRAWAYPGGGWPVEELRGVNAWGEGIMVSSTGFVLSPLAESFNSLNWRYADCKTVSSRRHARS